MGGSKEDDDDEGDETKDINMLLRLAGDKVNKRPASAKASSQKKPAAEKETKKKKTNKTDEAGYLCC